MGIESLGNNFGAFSFMYGNDVVYLTKIQTLLIVTIFESLFSDKPTYSEAINVLKAFSSRGKHYSTIEKIRNSNDKGERDELKKTLPIVCFAGRFTKRNKSSFVKGSSLLVLDFDEGDDLKGAREKLEKWSCTYSCFSSPSGGDRFKALIAIPQVIDDNEYKEFFEFFEKKWDSLDPSGKDVSRAAFITYDKNVYINENAKVFTREMLNKYKPKPPKKQTDKKLLDVIANWIRYANKGERQHQCCKAAFYAGGLCKMGQLQEAPTIAALEQAAHDRGGEVDQSLRAIKESFEQGKLRPVLNVSELDNAVRSLKPKVNVNDFLVDEDEMDEEIEDFYEDRRVYGRGIGNENFDHYWKYRDNAFYLIVGGKGQGKSLTVMYLLLLDAIRNNKKYVVALFENTPSSGRNILISFYLDKFAKHVYKDKRLVYEEAKKVIGKHFTFINPNKGDNQLTFYDVIAIAKQLNKDKDYSGLFVDPINAVKLPNGITNEYRYLVDVGSEAKRFATNEMSIYISAHPNSNKQREGGAPKDISVEGGGTLPNKADVTATLYRDVYGEDEAKYITDLRVTKVRDKELYGGDENLDNFPIRLIFDRDGYGFKLSCPYPNTAGYAPMEKIKVK
jgi:hypothetical protein